MAYSRGYHPKQSLWVALSRNSEGKDPIQLCRNLRSGAQRQHEVTAKHLSKMKHIHLIPARLFYLVAPLLLCLSLVAIPFLGLIAAGVVVVLGTSIIQQHKGALTPRQEDCLGVGITTSMIALLSGEYFYRLQGQQSEVLDLFVTLLLFLVIVLLTKTMVSNPGKVNGTMQSPYDVLDSIFDEKNFGPSAPAAGLTPAWESRKRCESCFAKRLPRVKHCHACETCVNRFDHHCHYIANCVGEGNHRLFICLIISSIMAATLWIYAAAHFIYHATPAEWEAIFHGDSKDILYTLIVACVCLTWLFILAALQITLIGWDTTSFEIFRLRRASNNSSSTNPRSAMTPRQFLTNITRFFIHPSDSDNHRDREHVALEPLDRRGSVCSYDDPKWCNAV